MSLLYFDGEYIEIPEYIIRIVKRAQTIVTQGQNDTTNMVNGHWMSIENGPEPSVVGSDGTVQTVSEYILGIIRAAQRVLQEDSDDIKDYDQFISNTFDAMLNEAGADNEETSSVINGVVDQLIEEVCSSPKLKNLKMPEMNSSEDMVETGTGPKENEPDQSKSGESPCMDVHSEANGSTQSSTDDIAEQTTQQERDVVCVSDETQLKNTPEDISETSAEREDHQVTVDTSVQESEEISVQSNADQNINNEEKMDNQDKVEVDLNDIPLDKSGKVDIKNDSKDVSEEELEKVAEKFVENICKEAQNIVLMEQENKMDNITDSTVTNTEAAGNIGNTPDQAIQNHSDKVHPEEAKPTVANFEDIAKSESLPTEGKHGKGQKYNVSKDKIKNKRRSRSIRNSFRRMFSCFSTKSSQME